MKIVGYHLGNIAFVLRGSEYKGCGVPKDLGVTVTYNLSPSNHVANIIKKANSRINMI